MADFEKTLATRIIVRFILTFGLVYLLSIKVDQYFSLTGGLKGYLIVASLLTLMNLIARPFLHIIFAPVHFLFGIVGTIAANCAFLWLTMNIAARFDPTLVTLSIRGGLIGFLLIALILGVANWLMKVLVRL